MRLVSTTATWFSLAIATYARGLFGSSAMPSGCERFAPTWMSLILVALPSATTDTVPGPSFETSPVRPSGRIAAPYGYVPVAT